MKITNTEIVVLSDPPPEKAEHTEGIGPLAVLRIRTDEGITGTSEIFSVPPGVAKAPWTDLIPGSAASSSARIRSTLSISGTAFTTA